MQLFFFFWSMRHDQKALGIGPLKKKTYLILFGQYPVPSLPRFVQTAGQVTAFSDCSLVPFWSLTLCPPHLWHGQQTFAGSKHQLLFPADPNDPRLSLFQTWRQYLTWGWARLRACLSSIHGVVHSKTQGAVLCMFLSCYHMLAQSIFKTQDFQYYTLRNLHSSHALVTRFISLFCSPRNEKKLKDLLGLR